MLKFDTLTRLDAIDPLPKLGRKVEKCERAPNAAEIRAQQIEDFECGNWVGGGVRWIPGGDAFTLSPELSDVYNKALADALCYGVGVVGASEDSIRSHSGREIQARIYAVSGPTRAEFDVSLSYTPSQALQDLKNKALTDMAQMLASTQDAGLIGFNPSSVLMDEAEQQAKTDPDGWIEWGGGWCPVAPDAVVDIFFADRTVGKGENAYVWRWPWIHAGRRDDIIAYRIHKKPEVTWEDVIRAHDEAMPATLETHRACLPLGGRQRGMTGHWRFSPNAGPLPSQH